MGAKNAVFPADSVLEEHFGCKLQGVWADTDAIYAKEIGINLSEVFPVVAAPHHVDNVKAISEVEGTPIHQAMVGTCTNGRFDDLYEAAMVLKGKKLPTGMQMLVIPASKEIYLQALLKHQEKKKSLEKTGRPPACPFHHGKDPLQSSGQSDNSCKKL